MSAPRFLAVLCFALLWLLAFAARAEEPTLRETSVLGGRATLLLPIDFTPLSAELLEVKYPNANRPSVAYSNDATTINVAISHTTQQLPMEALPQAQKSIGDPIRATYPSAQWFRDEIRQINGRPFILVEVRTPAADTEVRNIIVVTSLDGRVLVLSFNVTQALEDEWMPIGNKIIESIMVND